MVNTPTGCRFDFSRLDAPRPAVFQSIRHPEQTSKNTLSTLHLFDVVDSETWCLYFEEADLASQREDWAKVARLGDHALL